ncbi:MAG: DUF1285 domain-containing protein [Spirochaetes bacterium]|nr:DUF1285 domain-containing protein [Spirochaetota bacterium]
MERKYPEIPEYLKKLMESDDDWDEIRIDSEGTWFHNGVAFKNKRLISFFNKSIDVTRDGQYVIHYGNFVYPVTVEDAPLFVTGVKYNSISDEDIILIGLSSGEVEELDLRTIHYKKNSLYCYVRNGDIPAKFKRSPSYEMLQNLRENSDIYFIELCGRKIVLAEKMETDNYYNIS